MSAETATPAPLATPVRALLQVAALLVFLAGVQLFVFPLRTDEYFAWTIDSPMTAVFLGASYWAAVGLELTAARSARWSGARIAIPAVFTFTTVTLVVTLVHIDRFHLDAEFDASTRSVTWGWIAVYAIVPVLMVAATMRQRSISTSSPTATGLPRLVRGTLAGLSLGLLVLGLALLVDPTRADGTWPWALTPLTARAIGAWLIGLGTAAAHARLLDDRPSLRPLAITGVMFGALQAVALLRHGDELDWGGFPAAGYCAGLAVMFSVSLWALWPTTDT